MDKVLWTNDLDYLLDQKEYQYQLYDNYVLNADTSEVLTFEAWYDEIFYDNYEEYRRDLEDILDDELMFDVVSMMWAQVSTPWSYIFVIPDYARWSDDIITIKSEAGLGSYLESEVVTLMTDANGCIYIDEGHDNRIYFYKFPDDDRTINRIIKKCTNIPDDFENMRDGDWSWGTYSSEDSDKDIMYSEFWNILQGYSPYTDLTDETVFKDDIIDKLTTYLEPIVEI